MNLGDLPLRKKQPIIYGLIAATCLITFQAYLIAPLIPALQSELQATPFEIGLSIPFFAIPFGISSFFCSLYVDLAERKRLLIVFLTGIFFALILISTAHSILYFLLMRVIIGLLAGGTVQLAMSIMNDLFHAPLRDKPFSWLILSQAAGMTFGPPAGACLFQFIGWRWEFKILAFGVILVVLFIANEKLALPGRIHQPVKWKSVFTKCSQLLQSTEGRRIYPFIYLNGVFHSGLFVWISYYFASGYSFDHQGTGLVLLLFSLPGLMIAVTVGLAVKKYGGPRIMFWGLITVGAAVAMLVFHPPFWLTLLAVGLLSLAYVLTQPFYARIITAIRSRNSRGLGTGLGFGLLFLGYGTGPIIFQSLLNYGIYPSLAVLAMLEIVLGLLCRTQRNTASTALSVILPGRRRLKKGQE